MLCFPNIVNAMTKDNQGKLLKISGTIQGKLNSEELCEKYFPVGVKTCYAVINNGKLAILAINATLSSE